MTTSLDVERAEGWRLDRSCSPRARSCFCRPRRPRLPPTVAAHPPLLLQLLFGFGCNIISSDQFSDIAADMFFQRVVFDYSDMLVGPGNTAVLERGITEVARK